MTTTSANWNFRVNPIDQKLSTAYLNGQTIQKKMPLKLTLANGKTVEVVVQNYTSRYSESSGVPPTPANNWISESPRCHNAFLSVMENGSDVLLSLDIYHIDTEIIDGMYRRSFRSYDNATYAKADMTGGVDVTQIEIGK